MSADGYLNEVSFVDAGQGNLYAQYGPTAEWGKWSPSDELIFLGNNEIAGVPLANGDESVSMLGGALLGGGGGLLGAGLLAAGVGTAAILAGGGGDGGDPGPRAPYVNDSDANVTIGGHGDEQTLTITGGGEPGDDVEVTVGEETFKDERSRGPDGDPHYKVTLAVDTSNLTARQTELEIRLCMQASVELHTGSKTVLQYLLKPLYKSKEAFREP